VRFALPQVGRASTLFPELGEWLMRGFLGFVALASLTACSPKAELAAEKAWVRLPAVAGQPGAAYFTIHGGAVSDTLLAVSTPAALRTELHESMKGAGGMMAMQPLKDAPVPTGTDTIFAPGGKHVMLFSIGPAVKPGATVPLALSFAGGKRIALQAKVVGAGDPPPGD
jgi:periplasmic copper chaperone A